MAIWRFSLYNGRVKLNLLRCLVAVCENELQVSKAARELQLLQPSVSKSLMDLEKELGQPLFIRRGRRFVGMTPLCRETLAEAREVLRRCDNIAALGKRHGKEHSDIKIGTTHLQARYILPAVVPQWLREFPEANIQIMQGVPANLVQMLENSQVDVVICTEAMEHHPALEAIDAYKWNRSVILPPGHALARGNITLKKLAAEPLVTYVHGFTGRAVFDRAFREAGLAPKVTVAAADSDIIKTYVRAGTGVGVIAAICYDAVADCDLKRVTVAHLFPDMQVRLAFHRRKIITESMRRFMDIFCHHTATLQSALGAKAVRGASKLR